DFVLNDLRSVSAPASASQMARWLRWPRAADAAALGPCPALKPSGPARAAENGDNQPCGARDERRDEYPVVALAEAFSHHGPERAQHHGVRRRCVKVPVVAYAPQPAIAYGRHEPIYH